MKSYKILLFIILIISCLAFISMIYPKEGIAIGKHVFYFPSIEKVLSRQNDTSIQESTEMHAINDSLDLAFESLKDTVFFYKQMLDTHPARFYLPLNSIDFFDQFFTNISQAATQHRTIRILHYGDSQIEMDRISSQLRAYFQDKFGGGGPGLVPLVQNIQSFAVNQYSSDNFTQYTAYGIGLRSSTGNYGIMAKSFSVNGSGSFNANASKHSTTSDRVKQFSNIKMLIKNNQSPFNATLKDKKNKHQIQQECIVEGVNVLQWKLDTPTTSLNISFSGNADIYGIMLDDGYGVSVDNIPLRGSSGTIFTQIKDSILADCYKQVDVGLIILQFGGNSVPAIWSDKSVAAFKDRVAAQIRYIRNLYPTAPILYIGPSDMSTRQEGTLKTYPYLPAIIKALKEAAYENGAAYWDMYEVMGGENSMIKWVNNGYAGNDYIHFSNVGAKKIGDALVNSFDTYYNFFLLRKNTNKQQYDSIWNDLLQQ